MNRDDIIRMAREAGMPMAWISDGGVLKWPDLERFVALVLAAQPARTLTDEKIAELWHQNGGFHHHFARAIERYLKGKE